MTKLTWRHGGVETDFAVTAIGRYDVDEYGWCWLDDSFVGSASVDGWEAAYEFAEGDYARRSASIEQEETP